MSIIDLAVARHQLRLEPDYPAEQVQGPLDAAERRAAQFLNRAIFASAEAQTLAMAAVPAQLQAASDAYSVARTAVASADASVRDLLLAQAERTFCEARTGARETLAGIVVNADIRSGILLLMAHLYYNRAGVAAGGAATLPLGVEYLLLPYRIGWGV